MPKELSPDEARRLEAMTEPRCRRSPSIIPPDIVSEPSDDEADRINQQFDYIRLQQQMADDERYDAQQNGMGV